MCYQYESPEHDPTSHQFCFIASFTKVLFPHKFLQINIKVVDREVRRRVTNVNVIPRNLQLDALKRSNKATLQIRTCTIKNVLPSVNKVD